jgi:hypothetical protein
MADLAGHIPALVWKAANGLLIVKTAEENITSYCKVFN